MSVLVNTLKSEDIKRRVKAIESLDQFCQVLGPMRTRGEMIPFIKGMSCSIEFMEDEEEVIISLVESLPKIALCLGGPEHASLILECMEMLFTVDNATIVPRVRESISQIYKDNRASIRPGLIQFIKKFWEEEGPNAREMGLFFYQLILEDCSEDEVTQVIQTIMSNFKKEDRNMKIQIVNSLSNPQSCMALKRLNLFKPLSDEIKLSVGYNPLMAKVKNLLVEMLKLNDSEMKGVAFSMLREISKSNVRVYFKASVLFPVWHLLTDISEEDAQLYDSDFVWKKLKELRVDRGGEENLDVKDASFKKEIDIFACMLEFIDISKVSDDFFESALEEIVLKDGFFANVYLKNYWRLDEMARKEGEKNAKLKDAMIRIGIKKVGEGCDLPDKIIEGLMFILQEFKGSSVFPDTEDFLQAVIDICLAAENFRDRLKMIGLLIDLNTKYSKYSQMFKKKYSRLLMDNAFEVREVSCERFVELVNLENKGYLDKEFVQIMDQYLGQKSCFKRMTAVSLLDKLYLLKGRRKDELVLHYIEKILHDEVSNIRFALVELLLRFFKSYSCELSVYKIVDDRFAVEKAEDVREALDELLNICK